MEIKKLLEPPQATTPKPILDNTTDIILKAAVSDGSVATVVLRPFADARTKTVTRFELSVSEGFSGLQDAKAVQAIFNKLVKEGSFADFSTPIEIIVQSNNEAIRLGTTITEALSNLITNKRALEQAPRVSEDFIANLLESTKVKLQRIVADQVDSVQLLRPNNREIARALVV